MIVNGNARFGFAALSRYGPFSNALMRSANCC
jgi:hypothetical protein